MSRRVMLTLPDTVAADLERWADSQGRAIANLAGFIVETAVVQAKDRGDIPPAQTPESTPK
ncbi:MAG: hypothetical protein WBA10_18870 [Elainellaceae cyanobacterium]